MWKKVDVIAWRVTWLLAALEIVAIVFGWHPPESLTMLNAAMGVQFGAGAMARLTDRAGP